MTRMTRTQFAVYFFTRFSVLSLAGLCVSAVLRFLDEDLIALVAAVVFGGLWIGVAITFLVQMWRGDEDEEKNDVKET